MIFYGWSKTKLVGLNNGVFLFENMEAFDLFMHEKLRQPQHIQDQFKGAGAVEIADDEAKLSLFQSGVNVWFVYVKDGRTLLKGYSVETGLPQ